MPPDDASLALLWAALAGEEPWRVALRAAGAPAALRAEPLRKLERFGLDRAALQRLRSPDAEVLARWREWLAAPTNALLMLGSREYPQRLAEIPDAPLALWAHGAQHDLLRNPQIAVVGSRNPTRGGRATAEAFAQFLSASGVSVASGLAMGIDAAAHRGALHGCGGTVAVLGSGPDTIYPRCNEQLAADIAATGIIVSEYAPGTPPRAHHFPKRNRIIAGLSLGTLVIEATRRSGSLITAKLAADYGREVFAVPGSIHNPLSRGCHSLLRAGATLVEEPAEVLLAVAPMIEDLPAPARTWPDATRTDLDADPAFAKLVNLLGFEPVSAAQLMAGAGLTAAELSSMLVVLELEGHVEALPGGRYCRLAKRR